MAFIGKEIFTEYNKAKSKFADFDTWIAESIREEYGPEFVAPLMAAKICKTTRLPWENVEVFENVVLVLNGREALPGVDQEISVKEIAFAVATLKQEFPNDEFNDFICQYFAAEAGEEGIVVLPEELSAGQRYIPMIYLNEEQQHVQKLYLEEIRDYVNIMMSAAEANDLALLPADK